MTFGGAMTMRQEKLKAPSAEQEPQRLRVSFRLSDLALPADPAGIDRDQALEIVPRFLLEKVDDAAAQMFLAAADTQHRARRRSMIASVKPRRSCRYVSIRCATPRIRIVPPSSSWLSPENRASLVINQP